ncbi:hypothetical protein QUF63_14820 [Anaerolineales bacterium HSG25]|nr:hypothetical protein [Anaerolineales bacterium HSG25]
MDTTNKIVELLTDLQQQVEDGQFQLPPERWQKLTRKLKPIWQGLSKAKTVDAQKINHAAHKIAHVFRQDAMLKKQFAAPLAQLKPTGAKFVGRKRIPDKRKPKLEENKMALEKSLDWLITTGGKKRSAKLALPDKDEA